MFRSPNLMVEKEREIDYLSRLTVDNSSTLKTSKEAQQLLVDFILRHKLDLNGQTGTRYANFREYGFDIPFMGGFGSGHQIAKIVVNNDFNVRKHAQDEIDKIVSIYSKIGFEIHLKEECITFSLKKDYTKLEQVEYVEFVYNALILKNNNNYPSSKIILRHYIDGVEPSFSMEDREDLDMDFIIIMSIPFNRFNDIRPVFIHEHREDFCKLFDLNINEFDSDMNMLIQMLDV